ncbi:MAG TPA: DUF4191 domain-containing protein [Nocardioidaceae bacterium]|nr:DUF4191 domain-containing protein [Nocardioidaceae bacterium]
MAKKDQPEKPKRRAQLAQAYRMTKQSDPKIGLVLLGLFLVTALVVGGLLWLVFHPVIGVMIGLPSGLLAAMFVFGKRAEKAAYSQVEGQPGAAAASLGMLRKGWEVKPGVAFTKNQDIVHRVVGRPGIVLVGEGNHNRVRNLLTVEKKKHARMVEVPIFDIVAGDGKGEIPVKKLPRHIMKLPRSLRPADVTDVLQRLRALDAMRPQAPLPKGPMPQSARAARQMMRGQSSRGR